jgi:hypothetical protein
MNKVIFVMEELCFLCGTVWILNCYLDELRLQGLNEYVGNVVGNVYYCFQCEIYTSYEWVG